MTTKNHDGTKQHHEATPSGRPVLNKETETAHITKPHDPNEKATQRKYSIEDKRKEAGVEHTNGSTPRRDL